MALTQRAAGVLYLVAASLCWSAGGVLIKLIDLQGTALAGARSAIAAVAIWLYVRTLRVRITRRLLLGVLAYSGTVILFVLATKTTTAANAILLQYTAPVWVALFSPWLLREPISRIDWFAIALTLAGMGIFFLEKLSVQAQIGNLYAVASGLFFALCILSLRLGRDGSAIHMVLLGNILTALVCVPFLFGDSLPSEDILPLIVLGVGQLALGYIFFSKGIAHVSAIDGALIPVLEPILNPTWVALAVNERISRYSIVGGSIVLIAVTGRGVYHAWRSSRRFTEEQQPQS